MSGLWANEVSVRVKLRYRGYSTNQNLAPLVGSHRQASSRPLGVCAPASTGLSDHHHGGTSESQFLASQLMSALPPIDLVTTGSHGDVHPFLAIAHRLQAFGHPVRVFSLPHFAPAAAAAGGLPFVPVGPDDYEQAVTDARFIHPLRGGAFAFRRVLEAMPAFDEVRRAAWRDRKPAAVLGHPLCLGLRWACEEAGVPLVLAHVAPMTLFSRTELVPMLQRRSGALARTAARLMQPLVRGVLSHLV
jgi:Glycosyltransferase family 28 N-terminal domain